MEYIFQGLRRVTSAHCVPLGTIPRELRISSICPQPQNIGSNDKCQLNFLIFFFDHLVVENYPFSVRVSV